MSIAGNKIRTVLLERLATVLQQFGALHELAKVRIEGYKLMQIHDLCDDAVVRGWNIASSLKTFDQIDAASTVKSMEDAIAERDAIRKEIDDIKRVVGDAIGKMDDVRFSNLSGEEQTAELTAAGINVPKLIADVKDLMDKYCNPKTT